MKPLGVLQVGLTLSALAAGIGSAAGCAGSTEDDATAGSAAISNGPVESDAGNAAAEQHPATESYKCHGAALPGQGFNSEFDVEVILTPAGNTIRFTAADYFGVNVVATAQPVWTSRAIRGDHRPLAMTADLPGIAEFDSDAILKTVLNLSPLPQFTGLPDVAALGHVDSLIMNHAVNTDLGEPEKQEFLVIRLFEGTRQIGSTFQINGSRAACLPPPGG